MDTDQAYHCEPLRNDEDEEADEKTDTLTYFAQELATEFSGLASDDRDVLCDANHITAYLSEMNLGWKGDENPVVVANEYSKALHRSAALCDLAPEVFSASQVQVANYLLKQQRDTEGSIREIELPFELLNRSSQTTLGRTPYEYEIVLLQIDKHALGQNFQTQRDLPELNSADIQKH